MNTTTDFNNSTRYDMIQRLQKGNGLPPEDENKKMQRIVGIGMAIVVGFTGWNIKELYDTKQEMKKEFVNKCQECHSRKQAMTDYFKKAGSKTPEQMAEAVLATKNPRLLAAIAKIETRGNPHIRNTGYKKRHSGAFQLAEKYHGKVSTDPVKQAIQAENLLVELTQTMDVRSALNYYGGESNKTKGKYAYNVLKELESGGIP